jgi:hypothetical protein
MRARARAGDEEAAELSLLKLFHTHGLEEGQSYDLVARTYDSLGEYGKARRWQRKKAKFLYGVEEVEEVEERVGVAA